MSAQRGPGLDARDDVRAPAIPDSPYVTVGTDDGCPDTGRWRTGGPVVGLLALASAVALVVCLGYVVPSETGGWSLAWMLSAPGSPAASNPTSGDGSSGAVGAPGPSEDGEGTRAAPEDASDAPASGSEREPEADTPTADAPPADAVTAPGAVDPAGTATGTGRTDAGASAPLAQTAPEQQGTVPGGAGGTPAPNPAPEADVLHITVSVSSDAAGGEVSASRAVTLTTGASAYDALCALGLPVRAQQTMYGTYVQAIGGLAEKQHGASSGWMYAVNGRAVLVAASSYALADGDTVSWYYVTGA